MTSLKEVHGLNTYCGPAVLSALTGRSTDECAAVISSITGQTTIKGVFTKDILLALKKLRFNSEPVLCGRTLYGTILRLADHDGFYIIVVPHHYVALEVSNHQVYLIDNHTKAPLLANSSARMMQKVEAAWKVTKKAEPKLLSSSIRLVEVTGYIQVQKLNEYENAEDNTLEKLGQFNYQSRQTLIAITDKLTQLIQEL